VLLAEADLASKARVLSMSVATLALQVLLLDDLAGRLMLKLVVLTEWLEAEAAGETPAPVVPHTPLTLDAVSLAQHTSTGMLSQALSAVTDPCLTEIAYGSHHCHSSCIAAYVFYTAVTLSHALLLSTFSTHWKSLHTLTEVAKSPVLLPSFALITLHCVVAWPFGNVQMVLALSSQTNFLLPGFHLVMLFALACLLLRHFDRSATLVEVNQAIKA